MATTALLNFYLSMKREYKLKAKVWKWPGDGPWHFVTLDKKMSEEIRNKYGKGMIKIRTTVGKTTWDNITMELYDPIVPSGAQAVMEWVRLSHESVTGRDGYSDFYKKDLTINVLGPVGDKVEEWTLKGAFITSADFGEMDWTDSGEPATISLTLSVDYCILQY